MITPKEMREEINRISKSKEGYRMFLQEIGVVFKKNGKIEVKQI